MKGMSSFGCIIVLNAIVLATCGGVPSPGDVNYSFTDASNGKILTEFLSGNDAEGRTIKNDSEIVVAGAANNQPVVNRNQWRQSDLSRTAEIVMEKQQQQKSGFGPLSEKGKSL